MKKTARTVEEAILLLPKPEQAIVIAIAGVDSGVPSGCD
jgi:hypothetical protein